MTACTTTRHKYDDIASRRAEHPPHVKACNEVAIKYMIFTVFGSLFLKSLQLREYKHISGKKW